VATSSSSATVVFPGLATERWDARHAGGNVLGCMARGVQVGARAGPTWGQHAAQGGLDVGTPGG
jgi:hypothetical protein